MGFMSWLKLCKSSKDETSLLLILKKKLVNLNFIFTVFFAYKKIVFFIYYYL